MMRPLHTKRHHSLPLLTLLCVLPLMLPLTWSVTPHVSQVDAKPLSKRDVERGDREFRSLKRPQKSARGRAESPETRRRAMVERRPVEVCVRRYQIEERYEDTAEVEVFEDYLGAVKAIYQSGRAAAVASAASTGGVSVILGAVAEETIKQVADRVIADALESLFVRADGELRRGLGDELSDALSPSLKRGLRSLTRLLRERVIKARRVKRSRRVGPEEVTRYVAQVIQDPKRLRNLTRELIEEGLEGVLRWAIHRAYSPPNVVISIYEETSRGTNLLVRTPQRSSHDRYQRSLKRAACFQFRSRRDNPLIIKVESEYRDFKRQLKRVELDSFRLSKSALLKQRKRGRHTLRGELGEYRLSVRRGGRR